jgi:quercetin dioxygenase-like cupin family protein
MPNEVKWVAFPPAPGVQLAWLTGAPDKPGFYELRVRMAPGSVIPPHTHPDNRYLTVLSGELYVGLSDAFEPEKTKRFPAGSFLSVPAGTAHYVVAKNGEVIFQDAAIGPTGTNWIKK